MKRFFRTDEDLEQPKTKPPKKTAVKIYDCSVCALDTQCLSPKMPYTGEGREKILIIAEAPGRIEDEENMQLVGQAGQYLRGVLADFGYDLDRDAWKTNILICRPPNNREPSDLEIKCCRSNWEAVIRKTRPKFIWLMGGVALSAFYADRLEKETLSIGSWTRHCIPDPLYQCWVIPMYHPSFIIRNQDADQIADTVFRKDVRWALMRLKRGAPQFPAFDNHVELTRYEDVIRALQSVVDDNIVIDYETNSLKPYQDECRILTVSFKAKKQRNAYAFPFQWPNFWTSDQLASIMTHWRNILKNPSIKKIAHNMKFEHNWSRCVVKVEPVGWHFDTMLCQHNLDVRRGMSGLKTQAFLRYGVLDYEREVRTYITDVDARGFNRLADCDLQTVLVYNNKDTLIEERLYHDQLNAYLKDESLSKIQNLVHNGSLACADIEMEGISVDRNYYSKMERRLETRIRAATVRLTNSAEAEKFKEQYGRELSLNSSKDLGNLFYNVLNEKVLRRTQKTNQPAMTEAALLQFNSAFARIYLKLKKMEKLKNTYLKNFVKETTNGRMHPIINLNLAETGRSSVERPNFQNIPNRDAEAKKITRGGIIPSPGYELVSADYKQIEVCIQACYSQDKELIAYCTDAKSDMHRDEAMNLFGLPKQKITPQLRKLAKGDFVFAEIYGDWHVSIAKALWNDILDVNVEKGLSVRQHLKNELGINNLMDFTQHVQSVEEKFWSKFHATREWRDRMVAEYRRRLYVGTMFGFKRNGLLRRNQICNTPVQSSAFFCLLWSIIELNKMRKRDHWKSKIIGQIHDQIVFEIHPTEKRLLIPMITDVMCSDLVHTQPWIIVPLRVDFEEAGVDSPWVNGE